jgi:hypothetical protein
MGGIERKCNGRGALPFANEPTPGPPFCRFLLVRFPILFKTKTTSRIFQKRNSFLEDRYTHTSFSGRSGSFVASPSRRSLAWVGLAASPFALCFARKRKRTRVRLVFCLIFEKALLQQEKVATNRAASAVAI